MLRVILILIAATAGVWAQNWPMFRGPGASGVAANANPPVNFDGKEGKNLLWKVPIPGLAHSSPVVWGDRVYVTTAISSDPKKFRWGLFGDVEPSDDVASHTWKTYCLDKNTGKILWEQTAFVGPPKTKRHPKSSQASASPATDGRYVVSFFGSEGLYVYDVKGKLLWKKDLGVLNAGWFYDPDYEWAIAASPVIHKDAVFVQCDIQKNSFMAAFDLKSGKELWRTARNEIPSWGTPALYVKKDGSAELVTNGTNAIRAYDVKTGKENWWMTGKAFNSEVTVTTPVFDGDTVFVANGYPPIQPIYAIKAGSAGDVSLKPGEQKNGSVVWSKTRGGPYMPTPLAMDGLLYVCQNNGVLAAYQTATGERVYQSRVTPKTSAHSASPVAGGGRLYFASEDGDVFVVKAGPTFELLASNPVGEVIMATPAIAGDRLFVRTQNHLMAFGEKAEGGTK